MRRDRWAAALVALIAATGCAHGSKKAAAQEKAAAPPQAAVQPQGAQPPAAGQPQGAGQASAGTTPGRTLADDCVDLLNGRAQPGVDVAGLRARCEGLLRGGAVGAAGVGTATPPQGQDVPSGFAPADRELVAPRRVGLGMTSRGPVNNTLVTNPLGWFSGLGVNAIYMRPFPWDHASWLVGARYSRTNASNGDVSAFGLGTGADLFLFGRNNEGLRIGPRFDLSFGRETVQGSSSFARLGASAEIGFNYVAASGVTATVGGGYGVRLAGDAQDESFTSYTGGEDGPYLTLGVGYSW